MKRRAARALRDMWMTLDVPKVMLEARTGGDRCAGSALMLISFAVVQISFHVSIYKLTDCAT